MSRITNIEKTINEIAYVLSENTTIKRLLFLDYADALDDKYNNYTMPSLAQLIEQKYINNMVLEHDNKINLLQESFEKLEDKKTKEWNIF